MRAAAPRPGEPIRLVTLSTGEVRYRVVLDAGTHPNGKRRQVRYTAATLTEARSWVSTFRADRERGVLVAPDRQTFKDYADGWQAQRARRVREVTSRRYKSCLAHAITAFGNKRLAQVTREDVEGVINGLADAGMSKRTSEQTLFVLRSVFAVALDDGLIGRNPTARVQAAGRAAKPREILTIAEMSRLRAHLTSDRMFGVWLLSLHGLRRSEILGLRWSDVDFTAKTARIERGRVDIDGKRTVETPPKTSRGRRTVFLSAEMLEALKALRESHGAEFGFDSMRGGYIALDEVGQPLRPERLSDLWREACLAAGLPVVTLHSARHSSVSAQRAAGVPDHVVAAHHGHDEYVMRNVYSHSDDDQLAAAAEALSKAYAGGAV